VAAFLQYQKRMIISQLERRIVSDHQHWLSKENQMENISNCQFESYHSNISSHREQAVPSY